VITRSLDLLIPMIDNHLQEFADLMAWSLCRVYRDIGSLRGRMTEGERQVEGLFESLLTESFQ